jgi:hypothetical protein
VPASAPAAALAAAPAKIRVETATNTFYEGDVFTAKIYLSNPAGLVGVGHTLTASFSGAGLTNTKTISLAKIPAERENVRVLTFFAPEDDGTLILPDTHPAPLTLTVTLNAPDSTEKARLLQTYQLLPLPRDGSYPKR